MTKPIVITMGDPAGIGSEVLAKVLANRLTVDGPAAPITLIGAGWALEAGASAAGVSLPDLPRIKSPAEQRTPIALVDLGGRPDNFRFGAVDARCGDLAVRAVEQAAGWCLAGEAIGMVTCPINKAAIHAAGYVDDIGHQEILARLCAVQWTATMLMTPGLKVVHLSTHKSLMLI